MIQIQNLSVRFGNVTLFDDLSLHVQTGESVCIQGGSGSGKTTLLKAVLGFVPVQKGHILVNGIPMGARTADAIRRNIAWMPQELALPAEWVSEMIQMPFELKTNRECGFSHDRLMDYFQQLGLEETLYHKRVIEISGGQRQRIMLAVSALLDKSVLIVDEPTSALDPESCCKVIDFLQERCQQGTTLLAVSHDPRFAAGCNRVFTL